MPKMTSAEFRRVMEKAEMNQTQVAQALDIETRQIRRYMYKDAVIPRKVQLALLYLVEHPEARV